MMQHRQVRYIGLDAQRGRGHCWRARQRCAL